MQAVVCYLITNGRYAGCSGNSATWGDEAHVAGEAVRKWSACVLQLRRAIIIVAMGRRSGDGLIASHVVGVVERRLMELGELVFECSDAVDGLRSVAGLEEIVVLR